MGSKRLWSLHVSLVRSVTWFFKRRDRWRYNPWRLICMRVNRVQIVWQTYTISYAYSWLYITNIDKWRKKGEKGKEKKRVWRRVSKIDYPRLPGSNSMRIEIDWICTLTFQESPESDEFFLRIRSLSIRASISDSLILCKINSKEIVNDDF